MSATPQRAGRAPAAGRRWQRDPEGRRARILEAAGREFSRGGYGATRVADVARAAGVAEGTVFHLFGSKRGLLVAVGEAYGEGLARAAFGALPPDFHPRDVGVIVRGIFRYVRETEGPLAAFLLTHHPDEGGAAREASRARMLRAIEGALAAWRGRGLIPAMHLGVAAELQFGLVESAIRDCFLRASGYGEEAYVAETTRSLAACLGQRGDGGARV